MTTTETTVGRATARAGEPAAGPVAEPDGRPVDGPDGGSGPRRPGRPLVRRLRVRGWLRLVTPLHVGGLSQDPLVDLALAVDGQSRLYVPGTSLAGALRAACAQLVAGSDGQPDDDCAADLVRAVWGHVPRRTPKQGPSLTGSKPANDGWASRIIVADGLLTATADEARPLEAELVEHRTGNGIDRHLGTVAEGFLYGRAVVPRGAWLRLRLDLESAVNWADDPAERMLGQLLRALADGHIRLGAARTRGLGRVRLAEEHLVVHDEDLSTLDGLLAAADFTASPTRASDWLPASALGGTLTTVSVGWKPLSPVMVRAAVDGFDTKALPMVGSDLTKPPADAGTAGGTSPARGTAKPTPEPMLSLVLPGSSIKGALRTHAELIMRTVLRRDAPHPTDAMSATERSQIFRRQLEEIDVIGVLFGSAGAEARAGIGDGPQPASPSEPERPSESERRTPGAGATVASAPAWGRGALSVDDCYATQAIPGRVWRELLGQRPQRNAQDARGDQRGRPRRHQENPEPQPNVATLNPEQANRKIAFEELDGYGLARADHVAIDRWTGGAARGRLYSVLEPYRVEWEDLQLDLDGSRLARFDPELAAAAQALFLLLLRDVQAGRVRFGHGTNRGHGDITVQSITVNGFPGAAEREARLDEVLADPAAKLLADQWRAYATATRERLARDEARDEGERR
ncbi:RAMP superfamily CRISPR-associated protein [Frankia tisae]|uniref:RAMP superfamily CRISPR-associated protein n=1 Tax=Frankia tisae TaxID=2950104 RepID=UPI0021BE3770|nr:RAMP superfamily CRISPR-associated protein [Frankia tisae]